MLIDLHCHTTLSMDGIVSPQSAARGAREAGLDAVCFTDHDVWWSESDARAVGQREGVLVLAGVEVTTEVGHVLAFGLDQFDLRMRTFEVLVEAAERSGAALVLAHPFRRFYGGRVPSAPSPDDVELAARRRGWDSVHAVEAWNGETRRIENLLAVAVAEHLMLPTTGGGDAHRDLSQVGRRPTAIAGLVHSEKELAEAIRSGDVRAVA